MKRLLFILLLLGNSALAHKIDLGTPVKGELPPANVVTGAVAPLGCLQTTLELLGFKPLDCGVSQAPVTSRDYRFTFNRTSTHLSAGVDGLCLQTDFTQPTGPQWPACATGGSNAVQFQGSDVEPGTPPNGANQVDNSVPRRYQAQSKPEVDVRDYGAVGDGQVATDCYMTSGSVVLTCETSHFVVGDVGKVIAVYGSGPTVSGHIQPLASSIQSFQSATQVTLANAAENPTTHTIATITTCSRAQNVATCNTSTPHNFHAGQMVALNGVGGDASFTGVWPIQTVPSGTSFTLRSMLLNNVTSASGGTADGHSERVVWGTDNTAALQAAVDAAGTAGGAKIIIPKGLYLSKGVNMPCSQIGNFVLSGQGYFNCTIAYNNITFAGDGADVTIWENWDPTVSVSAANADSSPGASHPGLIFFGWSATGDFDVVGPNIPTGPIKNLEIYGITFREPKNATHGIKPIFDYASDNVKIHHNKFFGPYECVYQGGKSRKWNVHDNYLTQCGLTGPANPTTNAALNENGSDTIIHDNIVDDSGQCLEGSQHDNDFYNNTCDMRGTDITGTFGPLEWANLTSATYGLWRWNLKNNRIIGGHGAVVENVIGMFRDVIIEGNTFFDDTGIALGSGKETNNVVYGPQPPAPHGVSSVSGNTWIYTGAQFPSGTLFAIDGNQTPYLEDVVFDGNLVTYKTGFCDASPHTSCTQTADCSVGSCTVPNGIFAAAAPGFSGPKWQPSTVYASGKVVVPAIDNTYIYMNKGSSGTSGTGEPAFCTTTGCTVVDNTVTWTLYGSRPHATISNLTVSAPPGIAPFGSELRFDAGSSRQAVTITNFRYNNTARIITGGGPGLSDAGFAAETIPAGMPYTDNNRYSDSLPTSGKWTLGQTITKVTPTAGAGGQGWQVTRTGYTGAVWFNGVACTFGNWIVASPDNNHVFRAINVSAGVTGGGQPAWNTGVGATTTDNTCRWQESGVSAVFSPRPDGFVQLRSQPQSICDADHRGQFNYVAGSAGVKDIVQVCAKAADDSYSWRAVY